MTKPPWILDADLVAFVGARLVEDQAVIDRNSDGRGLDDGFPDYRTYDDEDTRAADAYIAHFGPARLRAEAAAKRARLEAYRESADGLQALIDEHAARAPSALTADQRVTVELCARLRTSVRLDAMAWAGHADFNPKWNVDG